MDEQVNFNILCKYLDISSTLQLFSFKFRGMLPRLQILMVYYGIDFFNYTQGMTKMQFDYILQI